MKLDKTVDMMLSDDYKERFKAEFAQLVVRFVGLQKMMMKWDNGQLDFEPTCPRTTYDLQFRAMSDYLAILEARAKMEGIDLEEMLADLMSEHNEEQ